MIKAKLFIGMILVTLLAVLLGACNPQPSSETATLPPLAQPPIIEEANFRFLISDEENAIGDFQSLNVTISKIGLQQGGESGSWTEPDDFEPEEVDLVPLQGDNATEIWSGNITEGEYTGVFIYVDVDKIRWQLNSNEDDVTKVMLPSEKLQIQTPFTVNATGLVNFVYDITVIKAGQSGQYIIKPELDQSGADQPFNEVAPKGKPENPEEEKPEEEDFEGIIKSCGGDNWTMEIEGEDWEIDVSDADIEGDCAEEAEAKVKGTVVADKTIKATEVEIKEPEEEKPEEEDFEGIIKSCGGDNWTMEIEGEIWEVDVSEAHIEGDCAEETEAEVKGTVVADKTIKATLVEIKGP